MIKPGKHYLSGIDTTTVNGIDYYLFILDGITYEAWEDPADGYRSWANIEKSDKTVRFTFPPQEVILIDNENNERDYIRMYDAQNGKLVLKIETDDWDNYYPIARFEYHPENMEVNKNRK